MRSLIGILIANNLFAYYLVFFSGNTSKLEKKVDELLDLEVRIESVEKQAHDDHEEMNTLRLIQDRAIEKIVEGLERKGK